MSARHFEGVAHAAVYAKFRPVPPSSLINKINDYLSEKYKGPFNTAVDVGCGSGQSTNLLASSFKNVVGLDISDAQIKEATNKETLHNVKYKVSPAENLPFPNESVELVTSCQALHWFDIPAFFKDVERILIKDGVLAVFAYNFPIIKYEGKDEKVKHILKNVATINLKDYSGEEVHILEDQYMNIQIPFAEYTRIDELVSEKTLSVSDVRGYVESWSGFVNYKKEKGEDAGVKLMETLQNDIMTAIEATGSPSETEIDIRYPYFLLLGRKG